jgi:hypothetical protein
MYKISIALLKWNARRTRNQIEAAKKRLQTLADIATEARITLEKNRDCSEIGLKEEEPSDQGSPAPPPQKTKEVWRAVPGFRGIYKVSNLGRVKRTTPPRGNAVTYQGKMLKPYFSGGHLKVKLYKKKENQVLRVDKTVAEVFLGACPDDHALSHKDGQVSNCAVGNLEYVLTAKAQDKSPPADEPNEKVAEEWRPFPGGFEARYEVSRSGLVRRVSGGSIVAPKRDHTGGLQVLLTRGGISFVRSVAIGVAQAFLGPCPPRAVVRHKNGDVTDNRAENLMYDESTTRNGEDQRKKLNEEVVRKLRRGYERGMTVLDLQEQYPYSYAAIYKVVTGRTWAHVQ